jgi:hypothetical protein
MPFKPGQSGNPGGRPKTVGPVRDLAGKHTKEAIETLASVMKDTSAPHAARVAAANGLLDRAHGKPSQPITGKDEEPLNGREMTDLERAHWVAAILAEAKSIEPAGLAEANREPAARHQGGA